MPLLINFLNFYTFIYFCLLLLLILLLLNVNKHLNIGIDEFCSHLLQKNIILCASTEVALLFLSIDTYTHLIIAFCKLNEN